ncbi:MAG: helix-turn-helix domain-containing protein, partial [Vicinamibacterales bacterium]
MATLLPDRLTAEGTADEAPAGAADSDMGLGQLLRRARERRGLTLQQLAKDTKIPQHHLEALERESLATFADDFYRRAEIRTYARAVHFDERAAMARCDRALQASVVREAAPDASNGRQHGLPVKRILIVIGVAAAAALFGRAMTVPTRLPDRVAEPGALGSPARQLESSVPQTLPGDAVPASRTTPDQPAAPTPPAADLPGPEGVSIVSRTDSPAIEAPAAARAPGALITEILVTTQPAGGRVTVNGIGWGLAPVTIRYLSPGVKRIRVTKEGYLPEERVVQLVEGEPKSLDIPLS